MKVSTTLSLSCILFGLSVMPTLAQQPTEANRETGLLKPTTITATRKTAELERGPIRMAPISVLPASLQKSRSSLCQDTTPRYFAERANGITIGGFIPTDVPDGIDADPGFSLSFERIVTAGDKSEVVVSLRYTHFTFNTNTGPAVSGDVNLISPTVGYRYRLGSNRRFYVEPAIGIVFASGKVYSGTSNTTDFAYGIGAGYDFVNRVFADFRYVAGGNSAEQGFIFSLGGHF